jgi:predicted lipoprotein
MKKLIVLYILFLAFACNSEQDETSPSFNIKGLLTDVTNQQILPAVSSFVNASTNLNTAVDTYTLQTTEANLIIVQNRWQQAALTYSQIYAFNIGEVRNQFMHQALYNWPTLPNAIENVLINNNDISEGLVSSLSPQIKTLSGLEYLLFSNDLSSTNTAFSSSEKRRNYLKFVALELQTQSERLEDIWGTTQNYADIFINSNATGIQGSFNKLYNGLYNTIDTGKITKIGKPAGLENSQNTNPELTQAYFSAYSLTLLKQNLISIEQTYFNTEGLGINDYVEFITGNMELNIAIAETIQSTQNAIDTIPVPLFDAITSHPNEVALLHQELECLGILFSVDVRSALSIIITSTDNDGD